MLFLHTPCLCQVLYLKFSTHSMLKRSHYSASVSKLRQSSSHSYNRVSLLEVLHLPHAEKISSLLKATQEMALGAEEDQGWKRMQIIRYRDGKTSRLWIVYLKEGEKYCDEKMDMWYMGCRNENPELSARLEKIIVIPRIVDGNQRISGNRNRLFFSRKKITGHTLRGRKLNCEGKCVHHPSIRSICCSHCWNKNHGILPSAILQCDCIAKCILYPHIAISSSTA